MRDARLRTAQSGVDVARARADLLLARFQLQAAAIEIDVLTGRELAQP